MHRNFYSCTLMAFVSTLLVAACTDEAATDSSVEGPAPVDWMSQPPARETEGWFAYGAATGFFWEDGSLAWDEAEVYPFAHAFFFTTAIADLSASLQDGDEDACYSGLPTAGASAVWDDLGPELAFSVGEESLQMQRDMYEQIVEYFWIPPGPTVAPTEGSPLSLDGVDLGLTVVQSLVLVEFETTWADFVQTGELHLKWQPSADRGTRLELSASYPDRDSYVGCTLADDGEARIVFPDREYPSFTVISRVQPGWADVKGHHIRTLSSFDISHTEPGF